MISAATYVNFVSLRQYPSPSK